MVSGSGLCAKKVVVEARHYILGYLVSIMAKELLNGQKVIVVRCEEICMSDGFVCQKMKYMRSSINTTRGATALARLKAYEGVPAPYDKINLSGHFSSEVGWNHYDTIRELEKNRREKRDCGCV
ncbi:60S ribosomal protein L13a-4 [Hibiscus syriacus]|uniref:60S ribosomal protein L13a-4 n=1 Tax=Hibiscus syriacus TaxID=106335 RepID=A0A6A3CKL4_HIBSY|nr:60S ribosomal protein L13a-4 [Hibiscus syriacus]